MNRNEAIEIIAEAIAYTRTAVVGIPTEVTDGDRLRGHYVYDALRAAGVIPAEGTVDGELRDAVKSIMDSWNSLDDGRYVIEEREFTALAMAWSKIAPDDVLVVDLDAIPAAPTGEETPVIRLIRKASWTTRPDTDDALPVDQVRCDECNRTWSQVHAPDYSGPDERGYVQVIGRIGASLIDTVLCPQCFDEMLGGDGDLYHEWHQQEDDEVCAVRGVKE